VVLKGNQSGKNRRRNMELERVQLQLTIGAVSFKNYFEPQPNKSV